MGSKKIRPITPGMRGHVTGDFSEITKSKPEAICVSRMFVLLTLVTVGGVSIAIQAVPL